MRTASAARVAARFNQYLEASRAQPMLVTRNVKPVAVQDEAEAEHVASGRRRSLRSVFEKAHAQLEKGHGVPHDRFWREVEQSRNAARRQPARRKKG